jgi:hypothetical protein
MEGASWRPLYDARYDSGTDSVELTCHAEVAQSTGEDWSNVKLTLSTVQPSRGTGPEELEVWGLRIIEPVNPPDITGRPVTSVDEMLTQVAGVVTNAEGEIFIRGGRAGEVAYIVDGAPISDPLGGLGQSGASLHLVSRSIQMTSEFVANFVIDRRESVPSGVGAVRVTVARWRLGGESSIISRPRLIPGAYRRVQVTNQEDLPLLPGRVSIFADADFLGHTMLRRAIVPGGDFYLGFGKVKGVEVTRTIVRDSRTVLSKRIRLEQGYEITLANHESRTSVILLEDLLPNSEDSRIRVRSRGIRPRPTTQHDNGMLQWTIELQPGQTTTVELEYWIEYPSDLSVRGL